MNSENNSATIELMLKHRSIRKFSDKSISTSDLERLIHAGQAAASSSFIQAYSIIRVTDKAIREKIAEVAGGQTWINESAEFLVYCADLKRIELA